MPKGCRTRQHEFYAFFVCRTGMTRCHAKAAMSTLSNVETYQGPCVRFTPDALPEAKSTKTGVSVRYVPDENKNWYIFRASYGREDLASDQIIEDGTYAYIAKRHTRKIVNGKTKKVLETLIPNLLFVYTTSDKADEYIKDTPALSYLSFYYNHFATDNNHKNPPLTISTREMENFILATCSGSEHLMFVTKESCHFKGGETVRVTEGAFRGVEGRVARVSGQQRVVVSLSNIGLISTAYIPTAFLQIVKE